MDQRCNDQGDQELRHLFESIFEGNDERSRSIKQAMTYQYIPRRHPLHFQELYFEAILNSGRHAYVSETLHQLAEIGPVHSQVADIPSFDQSELRSQARGKRTLCPHMPPPGETDCPLDAIERSPCLIKRVSLNDKEYGLMVNARPWGQNHCMLVTFEQAPQSMRQQELLAGFLLLQSLGTDYEGIFSGVLAGASVYHFHLQIHKGAAAIWRNLEVDSVQLKQFYFSNETAAYTLEGWPAGAFVFESADSKGLSSVVYRMLKALVAGDNDIPYNLGFRYQGDLIQLILFPRSIAREKPSCLNNHRDSWGRFAFMEMGGSVFLLTPEGYEATLESAQGVYQAIAEMSIQPHEQDALIRSFCREAHLAR